MSFLSRLFARKNPNEVMQPLYDAIVAEGRQVDWYEKGKVPDSLDGRFDMIAAILCVVLINMEQAGSSGQQSAWLTEIFVTDMDGQLRQIGIGDMIVGKHISKIMGAVAGRLGAYREALETGSGKPDNTRLREALVRNVYRGESPNEDAITFVENGLRRLHETLKSTDIDMLVTGQWPKVER